MFSGIKAILSGIKESGVIDDIARTYKEFLDAYIDAGFTRKEAVTILANQGIGIVFNE